jgi:hypothetical protein
MKSHGLGISLTLPLSEKVRGTAEQGRGNFRAGSCPGRGCQPKSSYKDLACSFAIFPSTILFCAFILLFDIEIDVQASWQTDVLACSRDRRQIPSAVFRLEIDGLFLAACEKDQRVFLRNSAEASLE